MVLWNSGLFTGTIIKQESFGIVIEFQSTASADKWTLVNVYGPCMEPRRSEFVQWVADLVIPDNEPWLFLGDFKFYRYGEN